LEYRDSLAKVSDFTQSLSRLDSPEMSSLDSLFVMPINLNQRQFPRRSQLFLRAVAFLALGFVPNAWAAELPESASAFIATHCMDCHDADTARAGFRIDLLTADFTAGDTAGRWHEVMNKINSGEMPPEKKPRPDAKEAFEVASWVAQKLEETTKAAQGAGGRVAMRRMNRAEYANTVRDLFSLDENFARRIEKELPADGKVGGFDRGSAGLFMDESQLAQYMTVADLVLDEAVFHEQPEVQQFTYDGIDDRYVHGLQTAYEDDAGEFIETSIPSEVAGLTQPLAWIPQPNFDQWGSKDRRYVPHGPYDWTLKNGGFEYLAQLRFYNVDWAKRGVTRDGWYRIRVQAGAFKGEDEEVLKEVRLVSQYALGSPIENVQSVVIDAPLDAPKEYEFMMYLEMGPPGMTRDWRLTWDFGDRKQPCIADPAYWDVQWKQVIVGGEIARAKQEKKPAEEVEAKKKELEETIAKATESRRTFEGPYWIWDPKLDIAKRPRLWIGEMEWEGPIVDWPPKGRQALFSDGEEREDDGYMREIFAKFLPLAYRRNVSPEELDRVVNWTVQTRADLGLTFELAVREGVKNVLCSPKFLYLGSEAIPTKVVTEPKPNDGPQRVDDWQFASRLSYLLWSSAPDEELYRLAGENKLRDPEVVRAQVKRMIADPKAWEFVRNFAGQWLGVRNFDNGTPPNRNFYRDYDDALRDSSKREPLEFCNEVLRQNLPITDFIDSDFLVIDERMARHYEIEGVNGDEFRRVSVPAAADGRRGGVLGMSGILTYLSDGTRTLPVRRATWVLDALWNQHVSPPPPNAGDLPAIKDRMQRTVRERLDEHRTSENCASCHTRVDPFGMALENYDAIGMWRERQNGEDMRGDNNSPELDVSGKLPNGAEFKSLQEFKAALLAEKERFVKGFTEKLLCYALGRPIGYADHLTVDQISAHAAEHEYRLQELIQATIASEFFQTK
jgi:mono/diheme cytochrome c family protein